MGPRAFPGCVKPCKWCLLVLSPFHEASQIEISPKLQQADTLFSNFSDQQCWFHQQKTSRKKQVKLAQLSQ